MRSARGAVPARCGGRSGRPLRQRLADRSCRIHPACEAGRLQPGRSPQRGSRATRRTAGWPVERPRGQRDSRCPTASPGRPSRQPAGPVGGHVGGQDNQTAPRHGGRSSQPTGPVAAAVTCGRSHRMLCRCLPLRPKGRPESRRPGSRSGGCGELPTMPKLRVGLRAIRTCAGRRYPAGRGVRWRPACPPRRAAPKAVRHRRPRVRRRCAGRRERVCQPSATSRLGYRIASFYRTWSPARAIAPLHL